MVVGYLIPIVYEREGVWRRLEVMLISREVMRCVEMWELQR